MKNFKLTPLRRRAAYLMTCEPKKYTEIAEILTLQYKHSEL